LPDAPSPGGRTCDREARALLGLPRAGAIFSAPARKALTAKKYHQAVIRNLGMSAAQYAILPKIAEVDRTIEPYWQRTVFEVHPELSFYQLNDDTPMRFGKRTLGGEAERRELLERRMAGASTIIDATLPGARRHHLYDAAVALWTARRIAGRSVNRLPEDPEWDNNGLRMEIVR
jgi:predicted RNase H-like nuclease